MNKTPLRIGALALVLAACGDDAHDHEHDHEHEIAEGEGCEHMQLGPAVAITATATAAGAPAIANDHHRYDITLGAFQAQNGGYVELAADAATNYVFFLNNDVELAVTDANGAAVAIQATERPFAACSDIAVSHTLALGVGTFKLQLGPTSETAVHVVVEETGAP